MQRQKENRGRFGGIGVENNTENLPLILLSRGAAETLERREVQANGEGAGRPRELSGRSYGRYFRRWMHLSQAMERITGRRRIVKHDLRLPKARTTLSPDPTTST